MMRVLVPLLPVVGLSVFLMACNTSMEPSGKPTVNAVLNVPFTLAVGQSAVFADENLSVIFVRVVADTRCPIDAMCVWAGDATMAVYVKQVGKTAKTMDLTLSGSAQGVVYEGFGFHAQHLLPGQVSGEPIPQRDYTVELLVDRPYEDAAPVRLDRLR
jgi:hypothetical protein